jgi:EmrB/QacA subfamily drug resistance transporter
MEVLDTSIANVALPHIAGGLSASVDQSTWVLTAYLVANAIVLPISGWIAGVVGRKRFHMSCVALFTISSLLCGLAPSLAMLIVFGAMQGAGGGGLQPSEQSILADTFAPEKLGMAFAIYGMAVVLAPAIGPALGGYVTDNFDWALDLLHQRASGDRLAIAHSKNGRGSALLEAADGQHAAQSADRFPRPRDGGAGVGRASSGAGQGPGG